MHQFKYTTQHLSDINDQTSLRWYASIMSCNSSFRMRCQLNRAVTFYKLHPVSYVPRHELNSSSDTMVAAVIISTNECWVTYSKSVWRMFWLRGDAQQRQSTYHMLLAAGDVESAAQKHRDETCVLWDQRRDFSTTSKITFITETGVRGLLVGVDNSSAVADLPRSCWSPS